MGGTAEDGTLAVTLSHLLPSCLSPAYHVLDVVLSVVGPIGMPPGSPLLK